MTCTSFPRRRAGTVQLGVLGGDHWCFLDWTQELPPDWDVTFSQFLVRTFIPQLSFHRLAPRVPPSFHSGHEEGLAYKIQLNEATQGPGQENSPGNTCPGVHPHWSSLPQALPGTSRTRPITRCSCGNWDLEVSPRVLAAVWAWPEMVCGRWGLSGEGSTACSTGRRAPGPWLSRPTRLWVRTEQS